MITREEQEAIDYFKAESESMELYAERLAVDAISDYDKGRAQEKEGKEKKEAAAAMLKPFLEHCTDQELDDIEHNLRARLQERRSGKEKYDLKSMPWQLVKKLHAAGCLSMDVDMLGQEANTPLRMDAKPYMRPAGTTSVLLVGPIKE